VFSGGQRRLTCVRLADQGAAGGDEGRRGATALVLRHLFGIQQGTAVTIVRGDTGQVIGQPTVDAYDGKTGSITLHAPLAQEVRTARGDVVEISPPALADPGKAATDPANATASFGAQALGSWGNGIQAQIRPMVGATMNILPDPTSGPIAVAALSQDVPHTASQVGSGAGRAF
jgi:hypothetical protein